MTDDLSFSNNETFLDPCCGSGAYLLSLKTSNPNQIYGIDTDKIAVMIAKINLILKYKEVEFEPQIYNTNFLLDCIQKNSKIYSKKFTYIATNPPWGAMTEKEYIPKEIKSDEVFSCMLVRGIEKLEKNGILRFLLPVSILNVKKHKDIREYILENGNLSKIKFYDETFTGVTTKYIEIEIENKSKTEKTIIQKNNKKIEEKKSNFELTNNKVFSIIEP